MKMEENKLSFFSVSNLKNSFFLDLNYKKLSHQEAYYDILIINMNKLQYNFWEQNSYWISKYVMYAQNKA